jgi:hypothetical protein
MICRMIEESRSELGFGTIRKLGLRNCFLVYKKRLARAFHKY